MSVEKCPECGAEVVGGREGCADLYQQLTYQALDDVRVGSVLGLAFDTYCMQHVETYCVSAKSYAAHLTRLCVGIEHNGDQAILAALQRWYHGALPKPDLLPARGTIRLTDVQSVEAPGTKREKIREWALNVWAAYASQHAIARQWVEEALAWNAKKRRG